MKFTIEIADGALESQINAAVGRAVADFTDKVIEARVADIVAVKVERIAEETLLPQLRLACRAKVAALLGPDQLAQQAAINQVLLYAAKQLLQATMR